MLRGVGVSVLASMLVGAGLVGPGAVPASAAPTVDGVFPLPGISTNNQIALGPDGNMWVTIADAAGNDVARITPAGAVTAFDVALMAAPIGISAGPDGRLWVTQNAAVVSFLPADPVGSAQKTAVADIADARAITLGPDGRLWTASVDKVVAISPGPPVATQTYAGTGLVGARWIANGGDSGLWIADFGGQAILNLTTAGGKTAYMTGGGPQGVAFGGGLAVYADPGTNPQTVGRITPGGTPQATQAPQADPFGVAFAADGAFWIAQFNGKSVGRLDSSGGYTTLPVATPLGGPRQIATGPGGTVWVTVDVPGDPASTSVARISGIEPPPPAPTPAPTPPAPDTSVTKAPPKKVVTRKARAKVTFRFTSSDATATFQCKVGKRADYRACTSPASYRLKPGRYTFRVRAVAGGLADASPATRSFRVVRR